MYRLIILTGPSSGLRITIESEPMVIGRDPDCAIRVTDEEVARKHAVIEHREDGIYIRDLGSMNRILVNRREVREQRLKHGDTIELGLTRFLVQALVQADVEDEQQMEQESRKSALTSATAVLLVLLAITVGAWALIRREERIAFAPADETNAMPAAVAAAAPTATPVTVAAVDTGKQEAADLRQTLQPMSDELRLVREDLASLRETMKTLSLQPAPPPPAPAAGPIPQAQEKPARAYTPGLRAIKIASVEQRRFPASEDFDEMRLLNIGLTSELPPEEIDPSAIHVEVSFFDEGPSNRVGLTKAIAPKEPLTPEGAWGQEQQKIVTATYMVPPGFRSREGGAGKYHGYRIRVFYHNELQDADARPKTLLENMNSSVSNTTHQPAAAGSPGPT